MNETTQTYQAYFAVPRERLIIVCSERFSLYCCSEKLNQVPSSDYNLTT